MFLIILLSTKSVPYISIINCILSLYVRKGFLECIGAFKREEKEKERFKITGKKYISIIIKT